MRGLVRLDQDVWVVEEDSDWFFDQLITMCLPFAKTLSAAGSANS
jgi:hypothetical protein